jgi:D-galactarolactone isomerase
MMWDSHTHVFGKPADHEIPAHSGYKPPERTLAQLRQTGGECGVERYVLVQPSVYGTDNSLMLRALAESQGAARGIVVTSQLPPPAELDRWRALGVRGARFNVVSEAGNGIEDYDTLADSLADAGLHAQFFLQASQLPDLLPRVRAAGAPRFVVDHFGGVPAADAAPDARDHLFRLLDTGRVWVKASGYYRFRMPPALWPASFGPLIDELAARYPERVVWASDWPHTWFFNERPDPAPQYAELLNMIAGRADKAWVKQVMSTTPEALYG